MPSISDHSSAAAGEEHIQEKQESSTEAEASTSGKRNLVCQKQAADKTPGARDNEESELDPEHKTRSEAISLIRARTASRASSTESSQQGSVMPQKKKNRKNKRKNRRRESHPPENSSSRGSETPLEHTSDQKSPIEPSVEHGISTSEPSSSQSQGPIQTPVIDPEIRQLHSDPLKSKLPPIPKYHQSGSGSHCDKQAADHPSVKNGQTSDSPAEHHVSAQQGPSPHSVSDTKDESKTHTEQSSSVVSGKSSPDSNIENKDKPEVHLDHPFSITSDESSSSRVNTEDIPGKYDHLLGDPNLDLSGSKNKGKADASSKGLNPSSKSFSPLSERSKGSPIAIRCAGASDPETPAKVPTKSRRSGLTPERLSPIQEASPPGATGGLTTPGSSTTAQTGWTGLGHQVTPDSNLTAEPSESASGPIHGFSGPVARPDSSHAHPGVGYGAGVKCALSGCAARCNLWDGEAVFCPRCGPHIEVRYCTQAHLHEDVKWHWVYCGQGALTHTCPADVIPWQVREGVPLIPCLHAWDTPEKHRQAVRFNAGGLAGDYFVFADWADLREAGFPANSVSLRCSSRVIETIRFDDPEEKDRFRRVLAVCLFCEYSPFSLYYTESS